MRNLRIEWELEQMSKMDDIKNKMNNDSKSRDARSELLGLNNKKEEEQTSTGSDSLDLSSMIGDVSTDQPRKKPSKKLKGIYLDEDVLEVYEVQAEKRERGWGSQLTSDLLRAVFEKEGLMNKR